MITGTNAKMTFNRRLRMGMVGGGPGAFIGEVHRKAAQFDGKAELVAGVFSQIKQKSRQQGAELLLDPARVYDNYAQMVKAESNLPDHKRIDFVSIVTPNVSHFPIAIAFLQAGFHVVCEKPMTMNLDEAKKLKKIVQKSGRIFALTHNYTGYPMVKQARYMVRTGILGKINKIVVEYPQGWLIRRLEKEGQKQAEWRTDPKRAGAGGCLGDIATHAAHLAYYITGLNLVEVCADLSIFLKGRLLDDDVNILLRYENRAKGVLHSSQICVGQENGLNIRVWGEKGGLTWVQEDPNNLKFYPLDQPIQILRRHNAYLCEAAIRASRIPPGHPEAFYEAFANIYMNVLDTIRCVVVGEKPSELEQDFPNVDDGIMGMSFIETVVANNKSKQKWTKILK